jgi:hypothetical protein
MNERPKTPLELANEMLLNSSPSEMLKEKSKESPTLDDHIVTEVDVSIAPAPGFSRARAGCRSGDMRSLELETVWHHSHLPNLNTPRLAQLRQFLL